MNRLFKIFDPDNFALNLSFILFPIFVTLFLLIGEFNV